MKKLTAFLVAILCVVLSTASYAQLTTSTMKLIRGTSHINFTAVPNLGLTTTYTWPQAPGATMPMQSASDGTLSFAAINLATQVTGSLNAANISGVLAIANGGTNSSTALTNGNIMISSGGAIVEGSTGTANQLLHGDLSWGAIDLATAQVTGTLPVGNGGTGAASLTQDGILLGNGTGAVTATLALTNNQILVGNTGAAPSARNLVAGTGVSINNDGSNITISNTMAGSSTANGQAAYTSGGTQTVVVTPGVAVAATSRILVTVADNTGGNLISAGVILFDATTFTVSISTDVDCVVNWLIINP